MINRQFDAGAAHVSYWSDARCARADGFLCRASDRLDALEARAPRDDREPRGLVLAPFGLVMPEAMRARPQVSVRTIRA